MILRTSHGALSPGELGAVVGNADAGEPFYRITVSLTTQAVMAYGKPEPLKPGMLVDRTRGREQFDSIFIRLKS